MNDHSAGDARDLQLGRARVDADADTYRCANPDASAYCYADSDT